MLVGDSVFDNGRHVESDAEVVNYVNAAFPNWKISLLARDGATTTDIKNQVVGLVLNDTDLLLSVGGNDALLRADALDSPVTSTADALLLFSGILLEFKSQYAKAVDCCLNVTPRVAVCTIYHGFFLDRNYQERVNIAIDLFNSAIIDVALDRNIPVLDLRRICNAQEDFEKEIEPSALGGKKIALAMARLWVKRSCNGSQICY